MKRHLLLATGTLAGAVMMTGLAGAVLTPAWAADLGGNCCADLEERISELEATTVRKGNRKVSVQLSGFVGHNVMFWDDSTRRDVYIGDGGNYGSRFRFKGSATIRTGLTAGFLYEFGINENALGAMDQHHKTSERANGDDLGGAVSLRDSTVWIKDRRLGMVKIGHGSTATDNLILVNLGNTSGAATSDVALYNGGFNLAVAGVYQGSVSAATGAWSGVAWKDVLGSGFDTSRRNHVLYETPTLAGFSLQTAVAEDNFWDIAVRYANEWNGVRVAFGIGYLRDTEFDEADIATPWVCNKNCTKEISEFKGSASIMHVPSGLFLTGAWGRRTFDLTATDATTTVPAATEATFWYLAGGISRNFTGMGNTVLYAEYSNHADFLALNAKLGATASDADMWGLGVVQHIDAAAMEVFLAYKSYSGDFSVGAAKTKLDDFSAVIAGTKINF